MRAIVGGLLVTNAVDGQYPAQAETLSILGCVAYPLVQDFVHPQYLFCFETPRRKVRGAVWFLISDAYQGAADKLGWVVRKDNASTLAPLRI